MENNKPIIPIVLAADHCYAMPLTVAITSIVANKKPGHIYKIYILDGGLDRDDKRKLETYASDEAVIEYVQVNREDFRLFPERRHLKLATYYRLIAPEIIPHPRIIYIDSDTIVNTDFADLYQVDLEGKVVAAVREVSEDYVRRYFFRPIARYFNAGALLIDTKRWKEQGVWKKAIDFIKDNIDNIRYADQDVLNHLLEDDWLEIDKSYNFQLDKHQIFDNQQEIRIFHFVGSRKPWHYLYNNRYKRYFLDYLKLSPWNGYEYPDKNLKTFSQKYILEPIFIFLKRMAKRFSSQAILRILKNIFWYFSNLRDSH